MFQPNVPEYSPLSETGLSRSNTLTSIKKSTFKVCLCRGSEEVRSLLGERKRRLFIPRQKTMNKEEVQDPMEAEVVEFVVPVENNKTLFVWDLEASSSEDLLHRELWSVFSSYGPLYLLKLCPAAPGFFSALVKFFTSGHAARAQRLTDGQTLFQQRPLKVCLSSKKTPEFLTRSRPLSHAHCLRLANHCLGFNGWSSNIITLKELDPDPDCDSDATGRSLKLGCLLQLSFPSHQLTARGAAVLQDSVSGTEPPEVFQLRPRLVKAVKHKALVQAFSNVLLVLLENGKVLVELKDHHKFVLEEEEEPVLQVTEVTLPADEDDDEEWGLTVS